MINAAMFIDSLNEFTSLIKEINANTGKPVNVKARNRKVYKVIFSPKTEFDNAMFRSPNWKQCWELSGKSFSSEEYDLCYFESV